MKNILIMLAVVVLVGMVSGCGRTSERETFLQHRTLKVEALKRFFGYTNTRGILTPEEQASRERAIREYEENAVED